MHHMSELMTCKQPGKPDSRNEGHSAHTRLVAAALVSWIVLLWFSQIHLSTQTRQRQIQAHHNIESDLSHMISCLSMAFFQFLNTVLLWWRPALCYSHCWCLRFEFIYIIKAKNQSQGKSQYHLSWNGSFVCEPLFNSKLSKGFIWFKMNRLIVRVAVSHCWVYLFVCVCISFFTAFHSPAGFYLYLFLGVSFSVTLPGCPPFTTLHGCSLQLC